MSATQKQYIQFFNKTEDEEISKRKGVQDFTLEEIKNLLTKLNPKNSKQAKVYMSMVNGIRKFSYGDDNIGFLLPKLGDEFYKQFD